MLSHPHEPQLHKVYIRTPSYHDDTEINVKSPYPLLSEHEQETACESVRSNDNEPKATEPWMSANAPTFHPVFDMDNDMEAFGQTQPVMKVTDFEFVPTFSNNNSFQPEYKKKEKTEMCKFWARSSSCPFGDECAFAHGEDELQKKTHVAA